MRSVMLTRRGLSVGIQKREEHRNMSKEWYVGEIRDTVKRAEKMSKYGLHGFTPAILSVAITGGMHSKNP